MREDSIRRQSAWSDYWCSGVLHSCPSSFGGNYDGAIAGFWQRAASHVPRGGRVLDLATGNGAVPLLLEPFLPAEVVVDAVDAAAVHARVPVVPGRLTVRFHSGVWMEQLPFADATFDLVCSQFGIEYAGRPDGWGEAARVLVPGGRLCAVVHHRQSVFARVAAAEVAHLGWLLAHGDGLLAAALDLAQWLPHVRSGSLDREGRVAAESARARFNQVQRALELRLGSVGQGQVLEEVRAQVHVLLAQSAQPDTHLRHYQAALEHSRLRSAELVECAMSEHECVALLQGLDGRWELQTLEHPQHGLMAWGLVWEKGVR